MKKQKMSKTYQKI